MSVCPPKVRSALVAYHDALTAHGFHVAALHVRSMADSMGFHQPSGQKKGRGMKTVSERNLEHRKEREEAGRAKSKKMEAMVRYIETLPETSDACALKSRADIDSGRYKLIHTACDGCKVALSKPNNGDRLSSGFGPSKFPATCPGCGWEGYILDYCLEEWKEEEGEE